MSTRTLAGLFLRLYPRSYRRRFEQEWLEVAEWHRRALAGARFPRARLVLALLLDTLKALPSAYGSVDAGPGGSRDPRGSWGHDARQAMRSLRRHPTFTLAAVLSIALGIGANTAIFSVFNAVLLRPLPYADAARLTIVWNAFQGSDANRLPLSGPEVQILREQPDLFEEVEGIWATSGTVVDNEDRITQVGVGEITPAFFHLLGITPAAGRDFDKDEGPRPRGVLISHELWKTRFGADLGVVGRSIQLNGRPVEIIGILPAGFTLILPEDGSIPPHLDVYTPLPWDLSTTPPAQHYLRVLGRLRPDVDMALARIGVGKAAERAVREYPELQATGDRFSVQLLQADSVRSARPTLLALLGGVALFLLLATANVASLVLARTLSRARELAIRTAMGASRARLARFVLLEGALVTTAGAVLGICLGRIGATTLWAMRPAGLARVDSVPLDPRVLLFTLAVSGLAGVAFSVVSLVAVRAVDPDLGQRSGGSMTGRRGRRLRELITAAEVAVGLVLVVGSALMVQSVSRLGRESVGFDPSHGLTFKVPLSLRRFPTDADRARLAHEIERRVSAVPGVTAVGGTSHLPFATWANWADAAPPDGTPEPERAGYFADLRSVTPDYLPAIGASLVAGRFFEDSDDGSSQPVVIVDEAMAARLFPGRNAVGRLIDPSRFHDAQFQTTAAVVIGVIRNIRDRSPSQPSQGQVFWPFAQSPRWELTFFARVAGDPASVSGDVEGAVRSVSPDVAPASVTLMDDYVRRATALTRFLALIGSVFAGLALIMSVIGLYGVVAFVTMQRTHELGMRVVLGATRDELMLRVLAHGLRIAALGVGIGLVATLALDRFLAALLYGVSPHDPVTLVGVAALLVAVALAAAAGPALRATRVDPVVALRDV